MLQNTGPLDRALRIGLGLALIVVAFVAPLSTPLLIAVGAVAAIAVGTGLAGFCPLYRLLGLSTCPVPPPSDKPA